MRFSASEQASSSQFASAVLSAPQELFQLAEESDLPEGTTWRYSEFLTAVEGGKIERVRFAKDGAQLQLTAVDGRRAVVMLPNDPELVDILAKNGVDISVRTLLQPMPLTPPPLQTSAKLVVEDHCIQRQGIECIRPPLPHVSHLTPFPPAIRHLPRL